PASAGQVLLLAGALAAAAAWIRRGGALEAALLGAIVPAASAGLLDADPRRLPALLAVPGAVLAVGLVEDVYRLAWHDELTGLPGRRAFDSALAEVGRGWAVAMADVDRFKRFNDRFGHEAGDQVLRLVASRLARVRGGRAFRWGGEEFAVLFSSDDLDAAREALEEVRHAIASRPFVVRSADRPRRRPERPQPSRGPRRSVRVTVSFGLAGAERGAAPDVVLRAADRALYRAKRAGRNRVVTAGRDRR
ncbi:MAG: GGDEF domain-containing protein, partial [Acidobacteria bacterium]